MMTRGGGSVGSCSGCAPGVGGVEVSGRASGLVGVSGPGRGGLSRGKQLKPGTRVPAQEEMLGHELVSFYQ
jgi:hypothetical protein